MGVEAQLGTVIAYALDCAAYNVLKVYVCLGSNFACHHNLTGGDESLAGNFALRVAGEKFVENAV